MLSLNDQGARVLYLANRSEAVQGHDHLIETNCSNMLWKPRNPGFDRVGDKTANITSLIVPTDLSSTIRCSCYTQQMNNSRATILKNAGEGPLNRTQKASRANCLGLPKYEN
jgi:hypothetical protein